MQTPTPDVQIHRLQNYFMSASSFRWDQGYEAGLHAITGGRTGVAYPHLYGDPVFGDGFAAAMASHDGQRFTRSMDQARGDYHCHREMAVICAAAAHCRALIAEVHSGAARAVAA